MSCCGKKINIVRNIVAGKVNYALDRDYEFTPHRISICESCEYNTWMAKKKYIAWIVSHFIEVTKNIEDLTTIPELPKNQKSDGDGLYCTLCKCHIPAKARVSQNTCPKGKWDK